MLKPNLQNAVLNRPILGDPGADSGSEWKTKRAGKYGTKKRKGRRVFCLIKRPNGGDRLELSGKTLSPERSPQDSRDGIFLYSAQASLGTLSSGNADAETCEKTRERTPLWWEFTNIKQHRRDRGFRTAKLIEIIDFRPLVYIRMTSFIEVRNQLLISNDEGVWNDDELLLL